MENADRDDSLGVDSPMRLNRSALEQEALEQEGQGQEGQGQEGQGQQGRRQRLAKKGFMADVPSESPPAFMPAKPSANSPTADTPTGGSIVNGRSPTDSIPFTRGRSNRESTRQLPEMQNAEDDEEPMKDFGGEAQSENGDRSKLDELQKMLDSAGATTPDFFMSEGERIRLADDGKSSGDRGGRIIKGDKYLGRSGSGMVVGDAEMSEEEGLGGKAGGGLGGAAIGGAIIDGGMGGPGAGMGGGRGEMGGGRGAGTGAGGLGGGMGGGLIGGASGEQSDRESLADIKKLRELGIPFSTTFSNETKTRAIPVQRTRMESRTRNVPQADGSVVQETFQVAVPYAENVAQNYTVQVPVQSLSLGKQKSERIVEQLAKNLDPNGKRELNLKELLDSKVLAKELGEGKNDSNENSETTKLVKALKLVADQGGLNGKMKSGLNTTVLLKQLAAAVGKRNAEVRRTRTWKRVKATPNTTRLMVGDKDELDLTGMQVNVQVDGFRARVLLDYFYYNDRAEQLEDNFKLRLPDDSSLYYFAFGESAYDFDPKGPLVKEEFLGDETQFVSLGAPDIRKAREKVWSKVKEARMVPKEKAAHAFRETVRRKVDPALVEWSGAGVFNARVFPLAPHKLHRIVIGYDVDLTKTKNGWEYKLDLPEQVGQCQVNLNVQDVEGVTYQTEPKSDPLGGKAKGKPSRRYRFYGKPKGGVRLMAKLEDDKKAVALVSNDKTEGEFFGMQVIPELPVEKVAGNSKAIFMLDTSLSSNPDKFNVWLNLLETTLNNNRDSLKQFNVLFFNVDGHFWQDNYIDNTPENVTKLMTMCDTLALEGATDLYGAIAKVAKSEWVYGSGASSESSQATAESSAETADTVKPGPGPDLFLLSDGAANWGETNLRLIGRQLNDHQLGSLFAYQTGMTGTSISSLRFLAGESGGAVFSVVNEDEVKVASTAHRKRPWKLESVTADGATDLMTAGRVQWVYPGQKITVVGRGRITGELKLNLQQAGETKTVSIAPLGIESELASRLYGQVAVGQLESLGAKVFDVAASYARHFRVTGDTCSLLMLESEADYQRFNIKPQEDLFVIKAKSANLYVADVLKKSADALADPKAQLEAWLERLETMPGMAFKMPTALKLVMEKIEVVAVSKPLDSTLTLSGELSDGYVDVLKNEKLDYDQIEAEAKRRSATSVDNAVKVYSSLVERNPGDIVIARDVAFSAMELGRPAQAYHLLRRVAQARPFEGSIYPALGQCLTQLGEADMALVYYEIALGGSFQRQGSEFKQIVSAEYMHLLGKIKSGEMKS